MQSLNQSSQCIPGLKGASTYINTSLFNVTFRFALLFFCVKFIFELSIFLSEKTCANPGHIDHTNCTLASTPGLVINYLDKITCICDIGYKLASGNLERQCQANGQLSGSTPVCSGEYVLRNSIPQKMHCKIL